MPFNTTCTCYTRSLAGSCEGKAEGFCKRGRLHASTSGEPRKISVGVVMTFPIQKTHVSEDIYAKASEPDNEINKKWYYYNNENYYYKY